SYTIIIIKVDDELSQRNSLKLYSFPSVLLLTRMNDPVPLEKTDAQLIEETKSGTLTSFEQLVKRYEKRLTGFAYKRVLDSDIAADVVQETFIRVFKKIDTFDITKPFSPWMYTIAKNLSL